MNRELTHSVAMKNKYVAAVLALTLGIFGVHRFYLGQYGRGFLYFMFGMGVVNGGIGFPLSAILGVIDAVLFFVMDQREFDMKYNRAYVNQAQQYNHQRERERSKGYYETEEERRKREYQERHVKRQGETKFERKAQEMQSQINNPHKQSGIKKYKEYDFSGAIVDFEKSLTLEPKDVAVHFNLACCYSMNENADKAYFHLDKAVSLGFNDIEKIKKHDGLAFLRIHAQFEDFEKNGFRILDTKLELPKKEEALDTTNLLDQIKQLGELRERGLLTEDEFNYQKRKLLG